MALDQFPPQEQLDLVYATLLIGELESNGWIEGPFKVNHDECWAALSIMQVSDEVELPPRERIEQLALGIMREAGIEEGDEEGVVMLLQSAKPDLEFAEE